MSIADDGGKTLWHGRFASGPAADLLAYTVSLPFDQRMWRDDITGSRAHVRMLAHVGLLTADERDSVLSALDVVWIEMESGSFRYVESDEDIHTAVERRVTELSGDAGAKLHTGRSRNDQCATDSRLWTKRALRDVAARVVGLQEVLLARAEAAGESRSPRHRIPHGCAEVRVRNLVACETVLPTSQSGTVAPMTFWASSRFTRNTGTGRKGHRPRSNRPPGN